MPHKSPKKFKVGRHARKRGFERHDGGKIQDHLIINRMIPLDIARS